VPHSELLSDSDFQTLYFRSPDSSLPLAASRLVSASADGCDLLEKSLRAQAAQASGGAAASSSKGRKTPVDPQMGKFVDAFYATADARLVSALPGFESAVLTGVFRIPSDIILSSELQAAEDLSVAALSSNEEEEKQVEERLRELQQRAAQNAMKGQELRRERKFNTTANAFLLNSLPFWPHRTGCNCSESVVYDWF
jgi:hypothetical protein